MHGDTMVRLGAGVATGLALVALAVLAGPGLFEFAIDYRVAGFSGTHVSGGQIGGYIAIALLFLLTFLERPRHLTIIAMSGVAIGVAGVLVVSHSRTAYTAAFLSALTAALA